MGDRRRIPGAVGFWPPLFFSPRTPGMAVSASPTCPWRPSHATAPRAGVTQRHLRPKSSAPAAPAPPGMGGRGPTPAADLGCLRAAREPLRIRIRLPGNQTTGRPVSVLGSLGVLRQSQGLHRLQPQPQPPPPPHPQARRPSITRSHARARTDICAQMGHLSC